MSTSPFLISPAQLSTLDSNVSLLDASWFMPNVPRNAKQEFAVKRLPKSQLLDLDEVASENELGLKHMMPSGQVFASACEKFGITPSSHVVLYDRMGIFSSPRALMMFRAFGHKTSSVLDGGLPRWEAEGYPLETTSPQTNHVKSSYPAPELFKNVISSYDDIVANSQLNPAKEEAAQLVLDARPNGRFLGKDPEPRPGLSSGHIPHALSLPFTAFVKTHSSYTTMLPPLEIRDALFKAVGEKEGKLILEGKRNVITSCGSGMTAAVLWLGLSLLDIEMKNIRLYDEAWTGYAMRECSVIEKS